MYKIVFYGSFLILLSLFTSCEEEEIPVVDSLWQVYNVNEGGKYEGSLQLTGKPYIPTNLLKSDDYINGRIYDVPEKMPWIIQTPITNGILSIDFPEALTLSDEYSSENTGGISISCIKICDKSQQSDSNSNRVTSNNIRLLKRISGSSYSEPSIHSGSSYSEVSIYYSDGDFTYKAIDGSEIQLKAGWNFWTINEGFISQDINDFFDQGYRWRYQLWDWVFYPKNL